MLNTRRDLMLICTIGALTSLVLACVLQTAVGELFKDPTRDRFVFTLAIFGEISVITMVADAWSLYEAGRHLEEVVPELAVATTLVAAVSSIDLARRCIQGQSFWKIRNSAIAVLAFVTVAMINLQHSAVPTHWWWVIELLAAFMAFGSLLCYEAYGDGLPPRQPHLRIVK